MTIKLSASSESKEAPVSVAELQELISAELNNLPTSATFIESVAGKLSEKSSKHKFLVLVTSVEPKSKVSADMTIRSSVGAVWDSARDGYNSFQIDAGASTFLITVYWVYAD